MMPTIADLRRDYTLAGLDESQVHVDPIQQFRQWFDQAVAANLPEPNAMTLATATPDGIPNARIVLLKDLDERGFVFYTNYHSQKGQELAANPRAVLVFLWTELERQVRVGGAVEQVSAEESDAYFQSRPLGSRLGAWASAQSQVIANRAQLEQQLITVTNTYADGHVPRPPHWGGYRVMPTTIEFWQGRPNRLHDRLLYSRQADGTWTISRLSP
ncbi:MAG: pyridoxamine 5'-phosphate oxidase [Cyanobacteria bacterium]|nr:pyridoxamine 5'-phosphate oxidase [Cyanobacteriota bacterium]MDW8201724.1 pyridoxamine 5'-phosphate oxidase [Cyanobacteriota bacterium SKYGB_h_bin112]